MGLEELADAFVQSGLQGTRSTLSRLERGEADMGPYAEGWLTVLGATEEERREFRRRAHWTSPALDAVKVDGTLEPVMHFVWRVVYYSYDNRKHYDRTSAVPK